MIGKGIFHTHLVVRDAAKSVEFYTGLFGMEQVDFKDGTLVILTTPGRGDLLILNPGGEWGYPGDAPKNGRARKNWQVSRAGFHILVICCRARKNMNELSHQSRSSEDGWLCVATTAVRAPTHISPIPTDTSSRSNMADELATCAQQYNC